jgi:hypothetical protein
MDRHTIRFRFILVKYLLLITVMLGVGHLTSPNLPALNRFETRCGWFSNPTPANAWLHDRDGEWTIGVQGGHQAEGDWPDFTPQQWIETNGNYGYGCACLQVRVNRQTHEVLEIKRSYARSLAACRKDRKLKEPK